MPKSQMIRLKTWTLPANISARFSWFGAKIVKHKGNVKKAGKEILEEIGTAVHVLSDGQINAADAEALFDLISPVSVKEGKVSCLLITGPRIWYNSTNGGGYFYGEETFQR